MTIIALIVAWTIIGLIFGLVLYSEGIMPHSNKKKNDLTVLMLGPAWWIIRGFVAIYDELTSWLESEETDPEN